MVQPPDSARDVGAIAAGRPNFWDQEVILEANGSLFKAARGIGSTNWHAHDDQDEVFLVIDGELIIELRDHEVPVGPGQIYVVAAGVEHRPRALRETRFLIVGRDITSNAVGGKPDWSYESGGPH